MLSGCTLPHASNQTSGNIGSMVPSGSMLSENSVVTFTCDSGWTFDDRTLSKTFTCAGTENYNPALEYCSGIAIKMLRGNV